MNNVQSLLIAYVLLFSGAFITFLNMKNAWWSYGTVIMLSSIPFYIHSVRNTVQTSGVTQA